jgi:hypothetical protein
VYHVCHTVVHLGLCFIASNGQAAAQLQVGCIGAAAMRSLASIRLGARCCPSDDMRDHGKPPIKVSAWLLHHCHGQAVASCIVMGTSHASASSMFD